MPTTIHPNDREFTMPGTRQELADVMIAVIQGLIVARDRLTPIAKKNSEKGDEAMADLSVVLNAIKKLDDYTKKMITRRNTY